jgi:hypothetical protein
MGRAAEGAATELEAAAATRRHARGLHAWAVAHDDSWLFLVAYVGLAVVLSVWVSLFWLVAVVAAHFALELIRQASVHRGWSRVALESAWELRLDVALVLFALVLAVYMDVVLGLVGLQGAARLGAATRVVSRFAGWERTLRGLLLSADDAAQVARAVMLRRRGATAPVEAPAARHPRGTWREPWGAGTWIALGIGGACLLLLAGAPVLTDHTLSTAAARLANELRPFP